MEISVKEIIHFFCRCRGCRPEDIYGIVTTDLASHTRYMIYGYLHGKMGYNTHMLAEEFGRDRRNIQRGMAKFKIFYKHHADIRDEYKTIVKKMEDAFGEKTPSGTM